MSTFDFIASQCMILDNKSCSYNNLRQNKKKPQLRTPRYKGQYSLARHCPSKRGSTVYLFWPVDLRRTKINKVQSNLSSFIECCKCRSFFAVLNFFMTISSVDVHSFHTKLCKECGEVNNVRAVASVYMNKLFDFSTTDTSCTVITWFYILYAGIPTCVHDFFSAYFASVLEKK